MSIVSSSGQYIIGNRTYINEDVLLLHSQQQMNIETDLQLTSLSLGLAMLVCCVIGAIGNGMSIRIFSHPSMRSSVNVLLTGLSAVDLIMLILVVPVFVLPCLNAYFRKESLQTALSYAYVYVYPLTIMAQSSSVWTFVAITVERYIAVCWPLKAPAYCTIGNGRRALITVYVLAVAYNMIRFGEYQLQFSDGRSIELTRNFTNNLTTIKQLMEVRAVEGLRANYFYNWIYFIGMYLLTHFVVPFSILLLFNFLMIFTILKAKAKRKYLSRKERSEYRTTVMMCIVILVFLLCNSLPMILNVLELFYPNLFRDPETVVIGYVLNDVANLLVVMNSTLNFLTYCIFCNKYRNLLKVVSLHKSSFFRFAAESRTSSDVGFSLLDSRYGLNECLAAPSSSLASVSRNYARESSNGATISSNLTSQQKSLNAIYLSKAQERTIGMGSIRQAGSGRRMAISVPSCRKSISSVY